MRAGPVHEARQEIMLKAHALDSSHRSTRVVNSHDQDFKLQGRQIDLQKARVNDPLTVPRVKSSLF